MQSAFGAISAMDCIYVHEAGPYSKSLCYALWFRTFVYTFTCTCSLKWEISCCKYTVSNIFGFNHFHTIKWPVRMYVANYSECKCFANLFL